MPTTEQNGLIVVRPFRLPANLAARLDDLARTRNWMVVAEDARGDADVMVAWLHDESRIETDTPTERYPSWAAAWVELIEERDEPTTLVDSGLRFGLPVEAADRAWIAVIENAARAGAVLREQRRRIEHLELISTTDALTGTHNRVHIISVLAKEHKRYERSGSPLSCIMIDIDHFKNVNDTYGHDFGDKILKTFADLLAESIRDSDVLGRYGGEEFLCVVPNTDLQGACALAEKLRRAVETHVFNLGFFNLELTASFGVSSSSLSDVGGTEQLLQWADRALYRAKQNGRNKVCVADGADGERAPGVAQRTVTRGGDKPLLLLAHQRYSELPFYKVLRERGQYEVVGLTNASDVIAYLSNETPRLALIESQLPPSNGWDVLRQIRNHTTSEYFPIAIIQSAEMTAMQDVSYRAGADDVLPETISYSELERRMQVFLRLSLLHQRFQETYERLTSARARLVKAERLSALGQMASGVAHDFNNILSAILGRTERLLWTHSDDELSAELRVIQKAAADGAVTIKRIQDFSRSISSLDSRPLVLADIIEDCVQLTRVRWKDEAEKNGAQFDVACRVDPALQTSGNPTELREVFTNLIINALDAMPEGGKIDILSSRPEGSDRFYVEVRDTGFGMEPSVIKRVFDPFFTTKDEKGTGLGLSMAYGIVTRMGGHVEVRSKVGEGTTFRVWFRPADAAEAPLEIGRLSPPVDLGLRRTANRLDILVVEDEEAVRDLFVDVLHEEGHLVTEADGARKAIELAEKRIFDVVLTDLGMPDLPGWDVAARVKELSPGTYVILTSGWGNEFSKEFLEARGVDHWLPKPVSLDELFAILRTLKPLEADRGEASA